MANVLILTNSRDGNHTDVVVRKITQHGSRVIRLNTDMISRGEHELTWRGSEDITLVTQEGAHCLTEVDSVWLRRPRIFEFPISDPAQRTLTENEFRALLSGIYAVLEDKRWLNTPHSLERAKLKAYQLKLAHDLGMQVPDSVITANPSVARKFCSEGQTIFKPLSESNLQDGDQTLLIPTTLMNDTLVRSLDLIRNQYVLLQRNVIKQYELRITFINGKFFVAKQTPTEEVEPGLVDWRILQVNGRSKYTPFGINADLERKIREMMKMLDLNFATLDFVVDAQGDHYFLEVNPNGQWFGYTDEIGLPASSEIANFLVGSR